VMVLIEFDIDSFKDVNEMLTHVGADKMIVKLAEVVGSVVGELDSVGRNGGDEFSVILNNVDPDKLASILQRITTAVSKIEYTKSHEDGTVENTGRHMSITGSARVIERGEDVSYEHIKKQADQGAIFQKINKKGSLIEWSPDLKPDLSTYEKRWEWASKLASTKINRDANELYAEWRGHPEGSSDRSITAYQIGLLTGVNPEYDNEKKGETPDTSMADSILEYLTQINIAAIEKRYGPPEDEDER